VPKRIEELLHRRHDLSTFVVHLTRNFGEADARANLLDILIGMVIEARTPMGVGSAYFTTDPAFAATQRTVCFTETPLEQIWMMCEDIEGRTVQLQPYGLVFTKTWARRKGANPVMYVDITPGHSWLTGPINAMLAAADDGHALDQDGDAWTQVDLAGSPIARLTPFFEPMGRPANVRREWWWEREWRRAGHVGFHWHDVVAVLVPAEDHDLFAAAFEQRRHDHHYGPPLRPLRYLDPRWGLERMVAALVELPEADIGPFP
jgi:hypothetical protein